MIRFMRASILMRVCIWISWWICSIALFIPGMIYLGFKCIKSKESHMKPLQEYFKTEIRNHKVRSEFMKTGIMYYV